MNLKERNLLSDKDADGILILKCVLIGYKGLDWINLAQIAGSVVMNLWFLHKTHHFLTSDPL
jgi:hypothetical protein